MRAKKTLTAPALALCILALSIGTRFIDSAVLGYGDQLYLSVIILKLIVFALPSIFYAKLCGPGYAQKLRLRPVMPQEIGFVILTFFTLLSGSAVIKLFLSFLVEVGSEFAEFQSQAAVTAATGFTDLLYIITAFAVIPALTEEFAFRAVILTEYSESGTGKVWAAVFSSVLYAFTRFEPDMLLLYFFIGATLSLSVFVTRSVFSAAVAHMLYLIFNILFEKYVLKLVANPENLALVAFTAIAVFLVFLILLFGEAERLFHNRALLAQDGGGTGNAKKEESMSEKKTGAAAEAALSPTLILCAGAFIIGSIIYR